MEESTPQELEIGHNLPVLQQTLQFNNSFCLPSSGLNCEARCMHGTVHANNFHAQQLLELVVMASWVALMCLVGPLDGAVDSTFEPFELVL